MKTVAAAVVSVWLATCCADALAEPVQGHVFNVRDHGAKGDGKSLDTEAIQKMLDACGNAGGGTVLLPPGTYLSRPLVIRTKTRLLADCRILANSATGLPAADASLHSKASVAISAAYL